MRLLRAFFLLHFAIAGVTAFAQTFDLEKNRVPMTELKGMWRFHTGDDPSWADPHLDDSSWALLRSDRSWAVQGYAGFSGIAWYRFTVIPAQGQQSLSLLTPAISNSFQMFANGELIGEKGACLRTVGWCSWETT